MVRACCCTRTQCVRALAWKINVDNDDAIFVSRVYYELLVAHGIHVHRRLRPTGQLLVRLTTQRRRATESAPRQGMVGRKTKWRWLRLPLLDEHIDRKRLRVVVSASLAS